MSLVTLRDKAVKRFADQHPNQAFDVAFIDVFAALIADFIVAFRDCQASADDAVGMMRKPSYMQDRVMRGKIYNRLGWRGYMRHGKSVRKACLQAGKDVTVEEVQEAYDDIG